MNCPDGAKDCFRHVWHLPFPHPDGQTGQGFKKHLAANAEVCCCDTKVCVCLFSLVTREQPGLFAPHSVPEWLEATAGAFPVWPLWAGLANATQYWQLSYPIELEGTHPDRTVGSSERRTSLHFGFVDIPDGVFCVKAKNQWGLHVKRFHCQPELKCVTSLIRLCLDG